MGSVKKFRCRICGTYLPCPNGRSGWICPPCLVLYNKKQNEMKRAQEARRRRYIRRGAVEWKKPVRKKFFSRYSMRAELEKACEMACTMAENMCPDRVQELKEALRSDRRFTYRVLLAMARAKCYGNELFPWIYNHLLFPAEIDGEVREYKTRW